MGMHCYRVNIENGEITVTPKVQIVRAEDAEDGEHGNCLVHAGVSLRLYSDRPLPEDGLVTNLIHTDVFNWAIEDSTEGDGAFAINPEDGFSPDIALVQLEADADVTNENIEAFGNEGCRVGVCSGQEFLGLVTFNFEDDGDEDEEPIASNGVAPILMIGDRKLRFTGSPDNLGAEWIEEEDEDGDEDE